jgi:hypothetical protein
MALSNFERMIQLAEEVFASRTDDSQLVIDEEVMQRLQNIHPATINEYDDGNGPVVWILLIPTTLQLMDLFLDKKITEKELFEETPLNVPYEAIYLCSAMVLEEYRNKGLAMQVGLSAIEAIRIDNEIQALFVWAFTDAGDALAEKVSAITQLPLFKR